MTSLRRPHLVAAVLPLLLFAAPAAAKTCKSEPLSATSSSTIKTGEDKRDAKAKDNAIKKWVKAAQSRDGIAYRFWFRSDDQKVECSRGKASSKCTVTARPCRIL